MNWYKQTFTNENIYALSYGSFVNGNKKAVIVSDVYKKAKHTSLQNMDIWTPIEIEDVPAFLQRRLLNKSQEY